MPFQYEPLDRSSFQIRLLHLHPPASKKPKTLIDKLSSKLRSSSNTKEDPDLIPECTLSLANLGEVTTPFHFNALSYTWGPETAVRNILINGQLCTIRENLWHFLCVAMRKEALFSAPMWIDQICVDQNSIAERNHQVSLMSKVYSQASSVFIWLGLATKSSDEAMEFLAGKSQAQIVRHIRWVRMPGDQPPRTPWYFVDFLTRPYWKRLWIVQEVLLAQRPIILCGEQTLPWQSLEVLLHQEVFKTLSFLPSNSLHGSWNLLHRTLVTGSAGALIRLRDRVRNEKLDLAKLVTAFCNQECTDSRDLVFGLLGLLESSQVSITADYSLSPLRVVFETYKALVFEGWEESRLELETLLPISRGIIFGSKNRHKANNDEWWENGLHEFLYNLAKGGDTSILDFLDLWDHAYRYPYVPSKPLSYHRVYMAYSARDGKFVKIDKAGYHWQLYQNIFQELCSWFEHGVDLFDWWVSRPREMLPVHDSLEYWLTHDRVDRPLISGSLKRELQGHWLRVNSLDPASEWVLETSWRGPEIPIGRVEVTPSNSSNSLSVDGGYLDPSDISDSCPVDGGYLPEDPNNSSNSCPVGWRLLRPSNGSAASSIERKCSFCHRFSCRMSSGYIPESRSHQTDCWNRAGLVPEAFRR
ncbi:hypothetical protein FKW77_009587 [Venturia effusa]|uniref:Heterokaryon incompatibility domain-containing protein n=1 Tax=Venturia effusa TaxID=50376 RepID=A0A517L454_9PEZI|nr:hypothetical protein FKW77_009587 [Venturia effusa]